MAKTKLRLGDEVIVTTGKDRNKTGKIVKILRNQDKVVVEGVNMKVKHIKKTATRAGEKVTFEAPLHISNVMLVDPKTKKPTRIGYTVEGGKKARVAKKSNEVLGKSTK